MQQGFNCFLKYCNSNKYLKILSYVAFSEKCDEVLRRGIMILAGFEQE